MNLGEESTTTAFTKSANPYQHFSHQSLPAQISIVLISTPENLFFQQTKTDADNHN